MSMNKPRIASNHVTKVPVLTVIGVDGLQTDRSLGMLLPQLNAVISETASAW